MAVCGQQFVGGEMTSWPKQSASAMNAFYGNPDVNRDGRADREWEKANLVEFIPPYQLYYPLERGKTVVARGTKFKKLFIHKKCVKSLEIVMNRIKKEVSPADIEKYQLDVCGGTYNFRLKRGGSSLSIHSWAAAIDLSHLINRFGRAWSPRAELNMMPKVVVRMFEDEGWTWGGLWSTPDGMHFQAANI